MARVLQRDGRCISDEGREFSRLWLSTIYPQVWTTFVQNRLAVEGRQV